MCARERSSSFGSTGSGRSHIWVLAAVLVLGALGACTEQSGSKGPTPSTTSGGKTGGEVGVLSFLQTEGPGADQFVLTLVVQSFNGAPLGNRQVFLSTTSGTLNPTGGVTDPNGRFVSVLTCGSNGTSATVTAFVEGFTATTTACAGATTATGPPPSSTPPKP